MRTGGILLLLGAALGAAITVPESMVTYMPLNAPLDSTQPSQQFPFHLARGATYLLRVDARNGLPDEGVGCMLYAPHAFPNACGDAPKLLQFRFTLEGPHTRVAGTLQGEGGMHSAYVGTARLGNEFYWADKLPHGEYMLRLTNFDAPPQLAHFEPRVQAVLESNPYDSFTPLASTTGIVAGAALALTGLILLMMAVFTRRS